MSPCASLGRGGLCPPFRRILFVAHREEILGQAWRTFRRIRPLATLRYYNGREKAPEADVLFASIQTLSRSGNLRLFRPKQFDYLVLDEFHHAAARSYRRVRTDCAPSSLLPASLAFHIPRKRMMAWMVPSFHSHPYGFEQ